MTPHRNLSKAPAVKVCGFPLTSLTVTTQKQTKNKERESLLCESVLYLLKRMKQMVHPFTLEFKQYIFPGFQNEMCK